MWIWSWDFATVFWEGKVLEGFRYLVFALGTDRDSAGTGTLPAVALGKKVENCRWQWLGSQ